MVESIASLLSRISREFILRSRFQHWLERGFEALVRQDIRKFAKRVSWLFVVLLIIALATGFWIGASIFVWAFSLEFPLVYIGWLFVVDREKSQLPRLSKEDKTVLWRLYSVLNQAAQQRENALLLTGSIFVTGSAFLLGQATLVSDPFRIFAVLGSWLIYSVWLVFFQLTSVNLTSATFSRLRQIEPLIGVDAHNYLYRKRGPVRRWTWLALLAVLLATGDLVLGSVILAELVFLEFSAFVATYSFVMEKERKIQS